MTRGKNVFISWTRGNPRTRDLGRRLPLDVVFVHSEGNLLVRYTRQVLGTWKALRTSAPHVIFIMLPPFPLLVTAWFYSKIHGSRLVADMHTGAFNDPRWKWSLPLTMLLLRGQTAIVTNSFLSTLCREKKVNAEVLHDVIEERGSGNVSRERNTVLCPVSYANDEPIDEILLAAGLTPELKWILTGKAPSDVKKAAPKNVTFTGFVTDAEFEALMESSELVLALTTRPHTMQRAGYEALSFGVPQVTSDFAVLREFLDTAALYTSPDAKNIADAVSTAFAQLETLVKEVVAIRAERIEEQQGQLASIAHLVDDTRQD